MPFLKSAKINKNMAMFARLYSKRSDKQLVILPFDFDFERHLKFIEF